MAIIEEHIVYAPNPGDTWADARIALEFENDFVEDNYESFQSDNTTSLTFDDLDELIKNLLAVQKAAHEKRKAQEA